jgi:hypothetical protein
MNNLRHWLVASVLALCDTSALISQGATLDSDVERALASISPEFIKAHVTFLGDDLLEGRRPGTAGYDIAARHVAASLEALGLQPAAGHNSFFQKVPLLETKPDVAATTIVLEGPGAPPQALVFGRDFSTTGQPFEPAVDFTAPLVFVGYGVEAPELKHDDYQAVDVKGKIAVLAGSFSSGKPVVSSAVGKMSP